jgi:hypothetical protein
MSPRSENVVVIRLSLWNINPRTALQAVHMIPQNKSKGLGAQ